MQNKKKESQTALQNTSSQ